LSKDFGQLVRGLSYVVVREFVDFDGRRHPIGENWTYLGHGFLPHEDGLTLRISPGGSIRLQWRRETQGAIIDNLESYLKEVGDPR
jgi:Domain of unknown function (DUF3601)